MNKTTEVTTIEMTVMHADTKWYIMIDKGYILISKKHYTELNDEDFTYDELAVANGYDRLDGEDYYKDFPIKKVVIAITRAIKRNKLLAGKQSK